jgi:hypothetical protein
LSLILPPYDIHFTREYKQSLGLSGRKKGDLGEQTVELVFKTLYHEDRILRERPYQLGKPKSVGQEQEDNNPDFVAEGRRYQYLIEVKNIFPEIGKVPGKPYPAFYQHNYWWVQENVLTKTMRQDNHKPEYPIKAGNGKHYTERIRITKPVQPILIDTINNYTGAAQELLEQKGIGEHNHITTEHAMIPYTPQDWQCHANTLLTLHSRLLKTIAYWEGGK